MTMKLGELMSSWCGERYFEWQRKEIRGVLSHNAPSSRSRTRVKLCGDLYYYNDEYRASWFTRFESQSCFRLIRLRLS